MGILDQVLAVSVLAYGLWIYIQKGPENLVICFARDLGITALFGAVIVPCLIVYLILLSVVWAVYWLTVELPLFVLNGLYNFTHIMLFGTATQVMIEAREMLQRLNGTHSREVDGFLAVIWKDIKTMWQTDIRKLW